MIPAEYAYRRSEQLQGEASWGRPEDLIVASLTRVETDQEVLAVQPPGLSSDHAPIPAADVFPSIPDTVHLHGQERAAKAKTPREPGEKAAVPVADWSLDRDAATEILRSTPTPGRNVQDAQPAPKDEEAPVPLSWQTA